MSRDPVSVAEARKNFARLISRAERGGTVQITRRGEAVAVLVSAREYAKLKGEQRSFTAATRRIRKSLGVDALDIVDADFEGLRDGSAGREVRF